jgi:hypothetical protein
MIGDGKVPVILTRAAYINGDAFPEGATVRMAPVAAWEAVSVEAYARFADPADLERARQAFVEAQRLLLARLNGNRWPNNLNTR